MVYPTPIALDDYPEITELDRPSVLLRLALALRSRSQTRWRVSGGSGLAYGILTITGPDGALTDAERTELTRLLGLDTLVGPRCVIEDSFDHYVEFLDRAEGRTPRVIGETAPWTLNPPADDTTL